MIRSHILAAAIAIVGTAAGILAGCAQTATVTPAETLFSMRAGYDAAFLAPAASYNELPRCPAVALCSDPKVVAQLRAADASAKLLLDGAEALTRSGALTAQTAVAAAQAAIDAAEKVLEANVTGVK